MNATPASSHSPLRSIAGLSALSVLAHLPSVGNGYVLDDRTLLADNPFVHSPSGLVELLRHELFVASAEPRIVPYYRPLSGFLNWASFRLVGGSASLQHAFNLLLHATVTSLVFVALRTFSVRPSIAFAAAAIFGVHPATADAVAYIGGRQDLLGFIVTLTAFVVLPRARTPFALFVVSLAATLSGALSHEYFVGLCVPLAAIAGAGSPRRGFGRVAAVLGGGLAAIAAVLALRSALGLIAFEARTGSPAELVRAATGVGLRLLRDVVFPTDLAVDVTPPRPSLALSMLLALAAMAAAAFVGFAVRRRRPDMLGPLLAGFALSALAAGLHAGVVLKYGFMSDRYAYALLVGLALALGAIAEAFVPRAGAVAHGALAALAKRAGAVVAALALVPLTWSRDASWHDERTLQEAMIADRPDDPESHLAAGMLHFGQGNLDAAYPHCRAYADARPESDRANYCIGSYWLRRGEPGRAATVLRPYALSRPGVAGARHAFLTALIASGATEEASATLREWAAFSGPELLAARRALDAAARGRAAP